MRHDYIGTEHLLLGLLREEEGLAARALASLGVALDDVRSRVAQVVGRGEEAATGQIPFTPRAKEALELSLREALSLGHNYIGTEHLLLGLMREAEGVAGRILLDLGLDAQRIREEVVRLLGGPAAVGSPIAPPPLVRRRRFARGRSPVLLVAVTWALGAVTLGAGILIGWAIWG